MTAVDFATIQNDLRQQERQRRRRALRYDQTLRSRPGTHPSALPPAAPLFDDPYTQALITPPTTPDTLEDKYISFHRANPHVIRAMEKIAIEAKRRGMKKWSIWGVIQVLRWKTTISTTGEPWKLSNDFTPIWARHLMAATPELSGFFDTKMTKIDIDYIFQTLGISPH